MTDDRAELTRGELETIVFATLCASNEAAHLLAHDAFQRRRIAVLRKALEMRVRGVYCEAATHGDGGVWCVCESIIQEYIAAAEKELETK